MFTLTDCIPHEIIVSILQSCSYVEIIAFSQTCKTYHDLVTRSSRLQLHVELESSGFQLSDMGFKRGTEGEARVLVEEFKRFRDGWLYLKIGKPLRLEPVDPDMRLYELRQGYYAAALSSTYTLPGIVKLISLHDKSSSRILSLGIQFSEFQIDPSQGLMVLVAVTDPISMVADIHLRSVFKAHPHRDAAYPDWTIHLPFHMDRRSSGIFVEVMDELLAIKFVSYEKDLSDILVWNWKSGHLLNRIEVQGLSCTFGFLTADSLVVFHSTERPSLHLLIYSDIRTPLKPSEHQPKCQVGDWPSMTPSYDFGFPDFPDSSFAYLLMRSEPAPTLYSTGPAMFLPKPETRVIQLSMTVIQNTGRERGLNQYQIFLSKERLLQVVERIPESSSTVDVPWEEWGELTTRWFNTSSTISPWICRAFGTRFIQSHPCGGDDDSEPVRPREYLSVLEFHQPTIRRLARHGCDERLSLWGSKEARRHYDLDCTDEETEYVLNTLWNGAKSGDEVFVDTIDEDVPSRTPFNGGVVVTRLPYRIVTRRKPVVKHSGWMMDNDVIIGMPTWQGDDMENVQNEYMNIYTPMA